MKKSSKTGPQKQQRPSLEKKTNKTHPVQAMAPMAGSVRNCYRWLMQPNLIGRHRPGCSFGASDDYLSTNLPELSIRGDGTTSKPPSPTDPVSLRAQNGDGGSMRACHHTASVHGSDVRWINLARQALVGYRCGTRCRSRLQHQRRRFTAPARQRAAMSATARRCHARVPARWAWAGGYEAAGSRGRRCKSHPTTDRARIACVRALGMDGIQSVVHGSSWLQMRPTSGRSVASNRNFAVSSSFRASLVLQRTGNVVL